MEQHLLKFKCEIKFDSVKMFTNEIYLPNRQASKAKGPERSVSSG